MDLGTIKTKLQNKVYSSPLQFAEDVRLTFANAMKYNPEGQDAHVMASILSRLFEGKWRLLSKKLQQLADCQDGMLIQNHPESLPLTAPVAAFRNNTSRAYSMPNCPPLKNRQSSMFAVRNTSNTEFRQD
eukprot:c1383_g2_i1 orf=2-391(+)